MTKEVLENRIAYAEDRLSALEEQVENHLPSDKGYLELVNAYNGWADVYTSLINELETFDEKQAEKLEAIKEKKRDLILRYVELGCRIGVPILSIIAGMSIAKLSYVQDANLALCNGRVMANAKDIVNIAKMKV